MNRAAVTDALRTAVKCAADAIPPAWPLAATVAVNPFLGQSGEDLAHAAARLARVAGVSATMPRDWYAAQITTGAISDADLAAALAAADPNRRPANVAALLAVAHEPAPPPYALSTVADLAAAASGIDWPGIIADRFGNWAAGWFDEGQALWAAPKGRSAYAAWRAVATHDLTPELLGLRGFAASVADAPETAFQALVDAVERVGLPSAAATNYFHTLLTTLGGWAQAARYRRWQAELAGGEDATIDDFLSVRLQWELALFVKYGSQIGEQWTATLAAHAHPLVPNESQIVDTILQEAAERGAQRRISATLAASLSDLQTQTPVLQIAFCIDVRSEVIRRALERIDPRIQTLGFAGFFGMTASHYRLGSDIAEHRLPVLLNPGLVTRAGGAADTGADNAVRLDVRVTRAWERFKLAAISSFAFVEAAAPTYGVKLIRDAVGWKQTAGVDPAPRIDPALDPATKVQMAASVLRAMSLTDGIAPLVILTGHGASVVNNPHASALHCGACGGYSGEVNARLLANLLNDSEVRAGLPAHGIAIPPATLFVAALHDTTTDTVTLYTDDHLSHERAPHLAQAKGWLTAAGVMARGERALRLPRADAAANLVRRSRDWAETRPEWALAGCQAFIAAPRSRTTGCDLAGRAFLHDYDWHRDRDFAVLELIITAPVVVASWISLQYYGSTVAPTLFGGGNKLIHNIVGGIGVVEGNGGTLRTGLPWQSVHDGDCLAHEPLRLTVCIEAPREAISAILARHSGVRALFDNRWLHLFALDEVGQMAWRYIGNLRWEREATIDAPRKPACIAA